MLDDLRKAALEYHRLPVPGKIEVTATKSLITQRDLALAYTPGVAAACEAIVEDPRQARELTARGNMVAVVTNGTAVRNGLRVVGKDIGKVKLVVSGAGAAALACLDMLVALGMRMENIWVTDIKGVVYTGRKEEMDENKVRYARKTDARKLADVIEAADVFLGLS